MKLVHLTREMPEENFPVSFLNHSFYCNRVNCKPNFSIQSAKEQIFRQYFNIHLIPYLLFTPFIQLCDHAYLGKLQ